MLLFMVSQCRYPSCRVLLIMVSPCRLLFMVSPCGYPLYRVLLIMVSPFRLPFLSCVELIMVSTCRLLFMVSPCRYPSCRGLTTCLIVLSSILSHSSRALLRPTTSMPSLPTTLRQFLQCTSGPFRQQSYQSRAYLCHRRQCLLCLAARWLALHV